MIYSRLKTANVTQFLLMNPQNCLVYLKVPGTSDAALTKKPHNIVKLQCEKHSAQGGKILYLKIKPDL